MQFKIYLIRRLYSSVVPECLKTYSPSVHFIPVRPNESAEYLREIQKANLMEMSLSLFFGSRCAIKMGSTS